jgi:hypothetical protein
MASGRPWCSAALTERWTFVTIRRSALALVLALVIIAAMSVFFVREVVVLRNTMGQLRQNDAIQAASATPGTAPTKGTVS